MPFSEIELARVSKAVGGLCLRRTRPEYREKLRLEFAVKRHDIELFEVRPHWKYPGKEMKTSVAKIRYVRTRNEWRLYWMRQDLKWHAYEPNSTSKSLEALVEVVDEDEFCCFFG